MDTLASVDKSQPVLLFEAVRDDERLAANGVTVLFGRRELASEAGPPRVVFVPRTGNHLAASHQAEVDYGTRVDIGDVVLQIDAHVWGTTFDQAWYVRRLLMSAVEAYSTDADKVKIAFSGEDWTDDEQTAQEGDAVIVRIQMRACLPWVARTTDPGYSTGLVESVLVQEEA